MVEREATIHNKAGIHVRPSGVIMDEVSGYDGTVTITTDNATLELNNVMALLSLGLVQGDTITLRVEGPNEEEVADKLVELFERNFDFPRKES